VVEQADGQPGAFLLAVDDGAPGIDQHTVAVRFPAVFMATALAAANDVALVFDRAGNSISQIPSGQPAAPDPLPQLPAGGVLAIRAVDADSPR